MHEGQRPPRAEDLNPFKGTFDAFDFHELVTTDPTWGEIYDSRYDEIGEEARRADAAKVMAFLQSPGYRDHLVGYVHCWQTTGEGIGAQQILTSFSGLPNYAASPPELADAVMEPVLELVKEGVLAKDARTFTLGDGAPLDKFPELGTSFEEWVQDFMVSRGGESSLRIVAMEHFADDLTAFNYWAARRQLFIMANEGKIIRDGTLLFLPEQPDPEVESTVDNIDAQIRGLPGSPRQLGHMGLHALLGKPQQRGTAARLNRHRR